MAEVQVNSMSIQPIYNIDTQHPNSSSPPSADSASIVSAVSSLNLKIKNLPNAIVAALSGTIRFNSDTDSNIGGRDDDYKSVIDTMIAALSSKRLDFWKGQGYPGSYSKSTDSTSAALRGGTENSNSIYISKRFTKKDMVTEIRKQAIISNIQVCCPWSRWRVIQKSCCS